MGDSLSVWPIQGVIELIENVKGSGFHPQDSKDQGNHYYSLLPTRQVAESRGLALFNCLVLLAHFIEVNIDFDALVNLLVHLKHLSGVWELGGVTLLGVMVVMLD